MEKKLRINVTVDKDKLERAKTKLNLFGGKLSTLFNAYLSEFVESMDKTPYETRKDFDLKLKNVEQRLRRLENAKE